MLPQPRRRPRPGFDSPCQRSPADNNDLEEFPEEVFSLTELETLTLSGNACTSIPDGLSALSRLRVLHMGEQIHVHVHYVDSPMACAWPLVDASSP